MGEAAEEQTITEKIDDFLLQLRDAEIVQKQEYNRGEKLYLMGACQILTHGKKRWEVLVERPEEEALEVNIEKEEDSWSYRHKKKKMDWDSCGVAALL